MRKEKAMREHWITLLLLVLLAPASWAVPGAKGEKELMSLEEAIRIGLEHNFGIRIARESARQAEIERGFGVSGFLPTLDMSGGWQEQDTEQSSNTASATGETRSSIYSAGINLSWTLFDGFEMFVNHGRYGELSQLGEARARWEIEAQVIAISQAYLTLVAAELLLDIADENLEISATRLEKERVRRDIGGQSSATYLSAQVDYNSDQASKLQRSLDVDVARKDMNVLLGREVDAPFTVSREFSMPSLELSEAEILAVARERNSGLAIAALIRNLAQRDVASARSAFFPRLSLNAGYGLIDLGLSGEDLPIDTETQTRDLSVGLGLSFDIFDANRRSIRNRSAKAAARIAELELADTELALAGDVREAVAVWEQRLELVELEEQNVAAAERNLDLWADRYRTGAASFLEFRDAQVSLALSRSSYVIAYQQARLAYLVIERLMGRLPVE